jgi:uncharacterized protein YabE (DUF348 family)
VRIPKSKALYLSAATVALLGGSVATATAGYKTVTVQDNGQRKVIRGFTSANVGQFLATHNYQVSTADRVTPGLAEPVKDGTVIDIEHPKSITLIDGERTSHWQTFAGTVGEFLHDMDIQLDENDKVNLSSDTKLTNGSTIRITRIRKQTSTKTTEIPFQTIRQRTDRLYVGQQRVLTHGVKGSMLIRTTSVFVNGHKVSQSESRKVVKPAVNQVILVGARPKPMTLSARGVGSLLVVKKLTVVATAYSAGGRTATGVDARPGVVAVDPSIIPLGSRVYIPGVGLVQAEDTGGAIHGNRIDICMSSEEAARRWGVRTVTVYIVQ